MKKNMYLLLVAATVLGSCSQSELPESNEQVEIRLASGMPEVSATGTRAPIDGTTFAADNVAPAKVMLTDRTGVYKAESDKLFYDGTMTFKGSVATGFATAQYYPSDGTSVYLSGLFPSTGWTVNTTDGKTADLTFDGKTDVMAATQLTVSKTTTPAPAFAFKHLLTKLIIKAQAVSGGDVTAMADKWGNITKIELKNVLYNKVKVTLADGTAAPASAFSGSTAIGFFGASGTAAPYTCTDVAFVSAAIPAYAASPNAIAYSLTAPFVYSGTTTDLIFDITTSKGGEISDVTAKLGKKASEANTQGLYCVVTFTFNLEAISATASIANWTEGGTAGTDIK